jgi:hypothetical protein
MYNSEIKKRYIKEKENSSTMPERFLERLFLRTKEFEERLGKDINSFTVYEITDFYKTINVSTLESLVNINSQLSLYVQWSLVENLVPDCQNHFVELNQEDLMKCINLVSLEKAIVSREKLYYWLGQMDNPSDAFVMLCLFEGIKGKSFCEIANLKMSDFYGNKVKLCTGREIAVSDKLIELAKETEQTYTYYPVGGSKETKLEDDGGFVIKRYYNCKSDVNAFQRGRRIYQKMSRVFGKNDLNEFMKPNSLVVSGMIDFINRRSKELGMKGEEYLFSKHVHEVGEKYVYDMNRLKVSFIRKYGEYLI